MKIAAIDFYEFIWVFFLFVLYSPRRVPRTASASDKLHKHKLALAPRTADLTHTQMYHTTYTFFPPHLLNHRESSNNSFGSKETNIVVEHERSKIYV